MVELNGTLTLHFVVVIDETGMPLGGVGPGSDGSGLRLESMDFESRGHTEFIQREAIGSTSTSSDGAGGSSSSGEKNTAVEGSTTSGASVAESSDSPTGTKRKAFAKKGAAVAVAKKKTKMEDESDALIALAGGDKLLLPTSPVGTFGITEMGMRCLEVRDRFY